MSSLRHTPTLAVITLDKGNPERQLHRTEEGTPTVVTNTIPIEALNLEYFVEWRQWAWTPAVKHAISEMGALEGLRILELGPNHGRMSCLFGLLGATVTTCDIDPNKVSSTQDEINRWRLAESVQALLYSGEPDELPLGPFDVVFTKSVLVALDSQRSHMISAASDRLRPGGKLIALENYRGGKLHRLIRKRLHPGWSNNYGVDDSFINAFYSSFSGVHTRRFFSTVAAITATK